MKYIGSKDRRAKEMTENVALKALLMIKEDQEQGLNLSNLEKLSSNSHVIGLTNDMLRREAPLLILK